MTAADALTAAQVTTIVNILKSPAASLINGENRLLLQ
jgi:hypothetical protein